MGGRTMEINIRLLVLILIYPAYVLQPAFHTDEPLNDN